MEHTTTEELLAERGKSWGDAVDTHERIAQVWSGVLGTQVNAYQVALCMTGLKLVRAEINPRDPDSLDDGHGYATIAQRCVARDLELLEQIESSVRNGFKVIHLPETTE